MLVSLTDTIATSSSFAARRGDEVDANREMIAVGASNVGAGLFQGFAISVSGSRTAVAEQSGAKTQVTGLVGAGLVVLMLVFVPGLLADLPQTALAAVVIMAAISLADIAVLRRFAHVRKTALFLSLVATLGVVFFGVLQGILIAAILSILLFFRRSWWPPGAVLGYVHELKGWHDVERVPGSPSRQKDVVIYRWEAPLFFANAGIFRQQVRKLVVERKPLLDRAPVRGHHRHRRDGRRHAQAASTRSSTRKGIHFAFVELRDTPAGRLEAYGLLGELDREHFFAKMKPAHQGRSTAHGPYGAGRTLRPRRPAAPGTAGRAAGLSRPAAGASGVDAHGPPEHDPPQAEQPLDPRGPRGRRVADRLQRQPQAEHARPRREDERRVHLQRLAVEPDGDRRRRVHLEDRRAPTRDSPRTGRAWPSSAPRWRASRRRRRARPGRRRPAGRCRGADAR